MNGAMLRSTEASAAAREQTNVPTRPPLTASDVLHASEVAALIRVPLSTVMQWAREGQIPAHKRGRRWLFLRSEIDQWIRL